MVFEGRRQRRVRRLRERDGDADTTVGRQTVVEGTKGAGDAQGRARRRPDKNGGKNRRGRTRTGARMRRPARVDESIPHDKRHRCLADVVHTS